MVKIKTVVIILKILANFIVHRNFGDLLKYEHHKATNEFLHSLSSNMVLPYIIQPTRITSY